MVDLAKALAGRAVLVTGASSGLGEHFARLCAGAGARLAIAARRLDRLRELRQQLIEAGAAEVADLELDVTRDESVEAAMSRAFERFGAIDVLVNNAGLSRQSAILEHSNTVFDEVMDTNLRGVWAMSMAAARRWQAAGKGGSIVNIASITGLRQVGGVASYAISKAGIVQMTKVLALELARYDIRVNALAPGYIETELNAEFFASDAGKALVRRIPMRRLGRAGELDAPFLLLATEAGSFMTGSVLVVDGGHMVSSL